MQCLHRVFDEEEAMFRHDAAGPARERMDIINEWWIECKTSVNKCLQSQRKPDVPALVAKLARTLGSIERKSLSRFGAINAHIGMNEWGIPQWPTVIAEPLKDKTQWNDRTWWADGAGVLNFDPTNKPYKKAFDDDVMSQFRPDEGWIREWNE